MIAQGENISVGVVLIRRCHVLLSGCLLAVSVGCMSPQLAVDAGVEALIDQLHRSALDNRVARASLVKMKSRAAPHLVQHLDVSAYRLRRGDSALEAARLLRVLREMESPAALPVCERILLHLYIRPSNKEGAAVLNEAIGCVYALFPRKKARDIYYRFVTGDARQYLKAERDVQHWGTGSTMDRLAVDVLTGFSLMVAAGDQRIQSALTAFLESISGGALQRMYFHQLAENGYSVTELTTAKDRAELEKLVEPQEK